MLVQGVNLPEELLRAQAADELVVFAGAGVSAPVPSSLPLFDELARQVGDGTGIDRGTEESTDHYFGKLKLSGVQVHKAVARILLRPDSRPHELHTLLTQLFPAGTPMRIVTTNFDKHFSAVQEGLDTPVETFYAPALPLGDDFAGLVYLHGSAARDPEKCVLTDEDFGKAYLTRAWATRFLSAMFERYTVVFVGYSHGDPVMNYLARGLSPIARKPRYAFTTEETKLVESWKFLGVHQIIYPRDTGENIHGAITRCVRDWVVELHRGLLEKAERIRAISNAQPPLEGEDADYLKFCLGTIETARIFFRHASTPDWISWLEKHGFLTRFFEWRQPLGEFERELGFWLVGRFFVEGAQEVLAVIQRNGGRIHAEFASRIWHRLIRRDHDANIDSVFSNWTALLLVQPSEVLNGDDWSMLLGECHLPEEAAVATQLFINITRPRLILKEHLHFFREEDADRQKVDFDLNLLHDADHYLSDAWYETIHRHIATCAPRLALPIFANLAAADNLTRFYEKTRDGVDPFWIHRQSIEGRGPRTLTTTLDNLINAARDIVIQKTAVNPRDGLIQAGELLASGVPILQRVAVYSVGHATQPSVDDKLSWLLQHNLLYRYKTDVFRFLELNFPTASSELRARVVETVVAGPSGALFEGVDDDTLLYERFNFLVWLHRVAPQCDHVDTQLGIIRRAKPDFEERKQPDLDFSWGGDARWLEATEGFNIEEITAQDMHAFVVGRPPQVDEGYFDRKRSRYCSSISAAAREKPLWGLAFLGELRSCELGETDLWSAVPLGIRDAKLSESEWRAFLEFAESAAAPRAFFDAATDVLEHGSRREENVLPDELMPLAQRVADRIWSESLRHTTPSDRQLGDWVSEAINRPGGKLAEFWLQRVSSAKRTTGGEWTAIPLDIAQSLRLIVGDSSGASAHARVVIASQLHYFFSIDPGFAQADLLPLFDWSRDAEVAEQCWSGFVMWGRWLPGFTEELLPSFDGMISRARTQPENTRRAIISHLTGLILYRLVDPLSSGWLFGVIRTLEEEDLSSLARSIDHALDRIDTSTAEAIWERWLKRYWQERILGRPKPISLNEANAMGCWALSLGKHFPDAVELVVAFEPKPRLEHLGFLSRIEAKGLARAYPAATANLLLIYFGVADRHVYADETLKNIWLALIDANLDSQHLRRVREAMFRLGVDPDDWQRGST